MGQREKNLLWMKDLLDHMNRCHEQLQYAGEGPAARFLADTIQTDLNQCMRLCENLRAPEVSRVHSDHLMGAARCA